MIITTALTASAQENVFPAKRTYLKDQVAWFHSKEDGNWSFSNMSGGMPLYWPASRALENRWNSSEHLYQAAKYDSVTECISENSGSTLALIRRRIRAQASPRGAKMTQKCGESQGCVRSDWDQVKIDVMTWVIELKLHFNFHGDFGRELLRSTGKEIVEVSRKDDFWGTKETAPGVLVGHNHLGRILMEIRNRHEAIRAGHFTFPEGFLLD